MEEIKRETRSFTTTGGNKIVHKTYATGAEFNEIQSVYLKSAKMSMVGQDIQVKDFDTTVEIKANIKTIDILIESLNDSEENCTERILNLPSSEYLEILEALEEASGKKKATEQSGQQ